MTWPRKTQAPAPRAVHEFEGREGTMCNQCERPRADPIHDLPLDKRSKSRGEVALDTMARLRGLRRV